jgi:hypothetical protein
VELRRHVDLVPAGAPNTAFADIHLENLAPVALPTTAPVFTTDNYAAGSPRWFLQFLQWFHGLRLPEQRPGRHSRLLVRELASAWLAPVLEIRALRRNYPWSASHAPSVSPYSR